MNKTCKQFFIASLAILLIIQVSAANDKKTSISGHWEGKIDIPQNPMNFNIDFQQDKEGLWKGDISIPLQQAKDIALEKITVTLPDVSFTIKGIPGNPGFKGQLSENNKTISGNFTQGGQTFPFSMERSDPVTQAKKKLAGFDKVIEEALKTFKVPGLAMAIVKENKIILARGFGYRDIEQKLPMTADTLLAIGSASKAFTTFALGILVDQGKLEWNKPVRNYIPWFRLYDQDAGERLTPRDLVTHRSGLPRHDLVWYNNFTASRKEFVHRLAHLKPTADLREKFQYNNLMFLTAGYLVEVMTEKNWENAIRTHVLTPLGMKRTNFSVLDSQKDTNYALPYREKEGKIEEIPFRNITNIGPAGSINSSINEMSNWVMVHINWGKFGGKQIINTTTIGDMHLVHMPTGNTYERPEISPADYGMGWFIDNYRGHHRVHHGGNIDGFSAMVSFLPQDGFGFVVLTNKNGTGLPELLIRHAIDRLLELEPIKWLSEAADKKEKGEQAEKAAKQKKLVRQKKGTRPAHKLKEYTGTYVHPGYGELKVFLKEKQLAFTYNGISTLLNHWHFETFNGAEASDDSFQDIKLTFRTNVRGLVSALEVPFEATLEEIVFKMKPAARFYDPEFLKQFTGQYDFIGQTFTVELKGKSLTLLLPGAPLFDLEPQLGDEFSIKQYKMINLKFLIDEEGNVTGFEFYQPSGVYTAKKKIP